MTGPSDDSGRAAELVGALGSLRSRLAAAAEAAGRDPQSITLIAVTKTRPAADVAILARLGVMDVGESKDQEARAKIAELAELPAPPLGLRWHVVGRLQTNKARSVATYAHTVHSLDRVKLARALADAVAAADREPLEVFAQVSLDADPQRGGVPEGELPTLLDAVAERPELTLRGVMTVPPLDSNADDAFARLAAISARVREQHPGAQAISAGMSDDLEVAIAHGATHVRVGSALLGRRSRIIG